MNAKALAEGKAKTTRERWLRAAMAAKRANDKEAKAWAAAVAAEKAAEKVVDGEGG